MALIRILLLLLVFCAAADAKLPFRKILLRGNPPPVLDGGSALVHWKMNEVLGNPRVDSADSQNALESGGVPDAAGKIDTAADFSGGGSHLEPLSFINPGDTDFSFSGWIFFNAHGSTMVPMQRYDDTASGSAQYQLESNGTYLRWGVSSNGTAINTWVVSDVEITNSVWTFVCVYHDSVNNLIGISMNNQPFVTAAHGGGVSTALALGLRFGIKNNNGGGAVVYFNGRVDSFTYWNKVLTQGNVNTLWNNDAGLDYPFP